MILNSRSHEDENTDLMLSSVFVLSPVLGDNTLFRDWTRFFKPAVDAAFEAVQKGF